MRGELATPRAIRDRLEAFAKNGCMRVVLVDPSPSGRLALSAWLDELGIRVAPFGDPHVAFLFLLGRLDEVDAVLVNGDDEPRTSRLLQRLEMLPAQIAVVTYCGKEPARASAIAVAGDVPRPRAAAPT